MGVIKELVQRADSWVNAMTGLGTLRDKLMHAQVVPGIKLQDSQLEAMFNDDDVARRVVAKLPREATRRGFKLLIEADQEQAAADVVRLLERKWQELDAMPRLRDGWIWARLYGGGSGVFVGADDGLPVEQPLNEAAIRSIRFLNVVKRPQLSIAQRYEDLTKPEYGRPELYEIQQAGVLLGRPREAIRVHESRLILFDGALTACSTIESPTGFDDSILQSTYAPLQQTATAWQSVAHLMTDASQGVLKIANLVDLVAAGSQETLRARIQLMDMARSVCRAILVDAEKESFERVSTSFAGLPEVMDKLMMRMSAAAEQPVTLLYGRSAAGLNATGESDIRGWYDTVAEAQTDELKPRLQRLLHLLLIAKDSPTRGVEPEQWHIEFNPLWLPTDKEEADTKKVKADTYVALVGAQIMTDAEAGMGLASDFPTIDVEAREELAEADAEEGLRPREVNTPTPPELEPGDEDDDGGDDEPPDDEPRGDSNQPRVPAGSPQGGQFASGGGGAGSGGGWVVSAGHPMTGVDAYAHPSGAKLQKIKTRTGRTKDWVLTLPDGSVRALGKRSGFGEVDAAVEEWKRGRKDAAEGGGDSSDPKGRGDSQARVPKGSPQGGQFASKGGPAAHAKALAAAEEYGLHGMPAHQLTALAEHSMVPELRAAAGALLKQKAVATTPQVSLVVAGQVQRLPDAVVRSHKPREIADALPRVQTDSGAEFSDRVWISDYMTATGASKSEVARQWASGEIDTARLDLVGAFANQRQRVESSQVSRGSADAHFILVTAGPPRTLKHGRT